MRYSLLLPQRIGNYYLVPLRVLSLDITKNAVRAALVVLRGTQRTVMKVIDRALVVDSGLTYEDRVVATLRTVVADIGSYDQCVLVLLGNAVVVKELTMPVLSAEKIKQILPFELDPLLPFALSQASVDGIVTKKTDQQVTVLAVAVKQEILQEQISWCLKADIHPDRVTVDMLELYALERALASKSSQEPKNTILCYMGFSTIRLGIVQDGVLRSWRVIPYGLARLAKLIGKEPEQLLTFGIAGDNQTEVAALNSFLEDVRFTLAAVRDEFFVTTPLANVTLLGLGVEVRGLASGMEHVLGLSVVPLTLAQAIQQGILMSKVPVNGLTNSALIAISAGLSLPITQDFNIYTVREQEQEESLLKWQLILAGILTFLLLGLLIGRGFWAGRKIRKEINAIERETIARLKKDFPTLSGRVTASLDTARNAAKSELTREKNIWFALSPQSRASFLVYLQELTTRLDAQGLGLVLTRLALTEDSVTMEGSVKDYDALKKLEADLRQSELFSSVPALEELKFTAKMTLNKQYRDGA